MLLKEAHYRGADVVATICPLCQFNLDAYQKKVRKEYDLEPMPVIYFSQLLGMAFGLSEEKIGFRRNIVPAEPVLKRRIAHGA
jgi:heterodisulfide reductase subunit B